MNTFGQQEQDKGPWYREPWAWFVLAPLIVIVIACSFLISKALDGADNRVVDNYYKEGRLINARMDEDVLAANLGVVADIQFDNELGELVVRLQTKSPSFPEVLTLEMSHISRQDQDHIIQLSHIAKGQYQAELVKPLQYRWYVRLRPIALSQDTAQTVELAQPQENAQGVEGDSYAKADSYVEGDSYLEAHSHEQTLWRLRGSINFAEQSAIRLTSNY